MIQFIDIFCLLLMSDNSCDIFCRALFYGKEQTPPGWLCISISSQLGWTRASSLLCAPRLWVLRETRETALLAA